MTTSIDLTGQRFGRLTAVRITGKDRNRVNLWLCHCDCGNESTVRASYLRFGTTKSCGCLQREAASAAGKAKEVHGHDRIGKRTPTYIAWQSMKKRCNNPKQQFYPDYGGRGIRICAAWNDSFGAFLHDMGERPTANHSLERLDVNKDYEPTNCVWATDHEQSRNRRNNRLLTHNGETKCLADWAAAVGVPTQTLWMRLNRGMPLERALVSKPPRLRSK